MFNIINMKIFSFQKVLPFDICITINITKSKSIVCLILGAMQCLNFTIPPNKDK